MFPRSKQRWSCDLLPTGRVRVYPFMWFPGCRILPSWSGKDAFPLHPVPRSLSRLGWRSRTLLSSSAELLLRCARKLIAFLRILRVCELGSRSYTKGDLYGRQCDALLRMRACCWNQDSLNDFCPFDVKFWGKFGDRGNRGQRGNWGEILRDRACLGVALTPKEGRLIFCFLQLLGLFVLERVDGSFGSQ